MHIQRVWSQLRANSEAFGSSTEEKMMPKLLLPQVPLDLGRRSGCPVPTSASPPAPWVCCSDFCLSTVNKVLPKWNKNIQSG